MMRAALFVNLSVVLLVSGCAELMYRYDQTTATTATAAMACRAALSSANTTRVASCDLVLTSGNKPAAQKCLSDWQAIYAKLTVACEAIKTAAEASQIARPLVAAAADRKKEVLGWIGRLIKAGADAVALFQKEGLRLNP